MPETIALLTKEVSCGGENSTECEIYAKKENAVAKMKTEYEAEKNGGEWESCVWKGHMAYVSDNNENRIEWWVTTEKVNK